MKFRKFGKEMVKEMVNFIRYQYNTVLHVAIIKFRKFGDEMVNEMGNLIRCQYNIVFVNIYNEV